MYMGTFRMTPVESLHAEACDPIIGLRRKDLRLRFLCRLRSNTTYTECLKYPGWQRYQKYVETKEQPNQQEYT